MNPTLSSPSRRLNSWKEIGAYFGRSVRTVQRWEQSESMPIHRHVHDRRGTAYAYTDELDAWYAGRRDRLEKSGSGQGVGATAIPAPAATRSNRSRLRTGLIVGGLAASLAAVVGVGLLRRPAEATVMVVMRTEGAPVSGLAFSPDGRRFAYTWAGAKNDNYDVYWKDLGGPQLHRLTSQPHFDGNPVWSPDGRQLAFTRNYAKGRNGVFLARADASGERLLADGLTENAQSWSPDGRYLAILRRQNEGDPYEIHIAMVVSGETRKVSAPLAGTPGDGAPAFSPDGRRLAIVRQSSSSTNELYVVPLDGDARPVQEPVRLTDHHSQVWGHSWTPDGKALIYSCGNERRRLWMVRLSGLRASSVQPLPFGDEAFNPSVPRTGDRLLYSRIQVDLDVWRARVDGSASFPVLDSPWWEHQARFSPDGTLIAFVSRESGYPEVSVADADGRNAVAITSIRGPETGAPSWRPDGGRIAFHALVNGNVDLFSVAPDGGPPSRLTTDPAEDAEPFWSHDGRRIYFSSARGGVMQVWSIDAEGRQPVQLTREGGGSPIESPDGRWIYYSRGREVLRVPASGGAEHRVLERVRARAFDVAADGIFFIPDVAPKPAPIHFFDFARNTTRTVLANARAHGGDALSISRQWVLYPRLKSQSTELVLVDHLSRLLPR
ncbi:MAG: hypothetical protein ACKV22_24995 [Bryobacteraceae bacterium]